MKIGDVIHGFELVSVTPVEDLSARLHLFCHQGTGAQLLWTGREDENKTFSVAFQTIPENDTGVFHILEHSVLCGSDKYPVKDPFVELLKGSLNTFLNAMTFPDKTVYPVSSRNSKDFRNLMGIYLDAVFHPAIYRNANIFRQEGWHCEMDEAGRPRYVGVVFGEMKGAFSGVDQVIQTGIMRLLFLDTCYGFVSGGDPKRIPELTYEEFLNAHRRFYHPSNAKFFLDGSVDLEQALADINGGCLRYARRREPDFALTWQEERPSCEKHIYYAAAPGTAQKGQAHFAMGRITGTWRDVETQLALEVLQDYLAGSNSAPLVRGVLERGLGQDVRLEVNGGMAQSFLLLQVRNTDEDKLPGMRAAIQGIAEDILARGLERAELTASLNRVEFRHRERQEPYGVGLAITAAQSWMYGGDPALYLDTGKVFDSIRRKLDTPYFEALLRKLLLGDDGIASLYVLPSETMAREDMAEEQNRLQKLVEGWSREEKEALAKQQEELSRWQQTPDSPEALSAIPHLALSDITTEPLWTRTSQETVRGVRVLRPGIKTSGIAYLNLYFALPGIAVEDLPAAALLTKLLGELPAADRSAAEMQREIKTNLGAMDFSIQIFSRPGAYDQCTPYFHVSVSVLESKAAEAARLLREVLLNTNLNQPEKIKEIARQFQLELQQGIIMAGHQFGAMHALSGQTAEDMAQEYAGGYTCYDRVRTAVADFDRSFPSILKTLEAVQGCFTAANLTLGVTGQIPPELVDRLCGGFPEGEVIDGTLCRAEQVQVRDAILVPAGIAYAAQGINLYRQGFENHGSLLLLSKLLSLNYLWNEVRVQGGAYGAGLAVRPNGGVFCYSFRDPNPARSFGVYRNAAEYLRKSCEEGSQLSQLIIGAVSDSEPLQGANAASQLSIGRVLRGITLEQKRKERQELLAATHQDLARCCALLDMLAEKGGVCVIGNETLVESCGDLIETRLRG